MLVRQQFGRRGLLQNAGKKGRGQVRVKKAFLVLGKNGVVPDLVIHREPDKPAKQEIVIQLLHQQPGATDGIQDLQQQGAQQLLRGDGRTSFPGIPGLKLTGQFGQGLIHHVPDGP
jgi:hypothetical protein